MTSQLNEVKKYLETHPEGLTSKQAFNKFGITRLSSIIYNLRYKHGMRIGTETKMSKNRYGRLTYFACYKIVD